MNWSDNITFFFLGCKVKFDGKYAGDQIKPLNLTKTGEAKIYWPVKEWNDVVTSFNIISIAFYYNGSEVQNKFLTKKGNPKKRGDGNWGIILKVFFWSCSSGNEHVFVKVPQTTGFEGRLSYFISVGSNVQTLSWPAFQS